jgi:hypothetical protein
VEIKSGFRPLLEMLLPIKKKSQNYIFGLEQLGVSVFKA